MGKLRHNPEKKAWKGFSFRAAGRNRQIRIRDLKDKAMAKADEEAMLIRFTHPTDSIGKVAW